MLAYEFLSAIVLSLFALCLGNGTLPIDALNFIFFVAVAPGALFIAIHIDEKFKGQGLKVIGICLVCLFLIGYGLRSSEEDAKQDSNSAEPKKISAEDDRPAAEEDLYDPSIVDDNYDYGYDPELLPGLMPEDDDGPADFKRMAPHYEDERWPTTLPELIGIPEEQRWYNAYQNLGYECTVVGPVVNVYQAVNEPGMPVFVDIGETYPSSGNVTLLIWAQDIDPFLEMLDAVDDGGAWLSVSGYLNNYNGMAQFNTAMSYIEFQWWTNVS